MRVCAIDVGTNTVNTLVADVVDGRLAIVEDAERFARLGQGVDANKMLAPEAIERVLGCLAEARATAERLGAERVVIGATSASRDAANVGVLVDAARERLGLDYQVISGAEEAALSFRGALSQWRDAPDGPVVVVDVGGGSTEVAVGTRAGGVSARTSLDVGSVRLTERRFPVRPPDAADVQAARGDVRSAAETLPGDAAAAVENGAPVVATGSVARLVARLAGVDTSAGAPAPTVPTTAVAEISERLLGLTPAEALAIDVGALTGREDIAAAAVLVLHETLRALGAGAFVTTRGGLRHGLALAAADRP